MTPEQEQLVRTLNHLGTLLNGMNDLMARIVNAQNCFKNDLEEVAFSVAKLVEQLGKKEDKK